MKTRHISGFFGFSQLWSAPALIFLTALFLCGAVAGCFAGRMAAGSGAELIARLAASLENSAAQPPAGRDALFAALGAFGWQFTVLLAGWTRPSSLFLSLLCAARGFTLSFSVSAMLRALGTQGIWRSLAASGAAAVVTVPCLLLTATACFIAAQEAPRGVPGGYFYALGRYRAALLLCTLAVIWAGTLQLPLAWIVERWIV